MAGIPQVKERHQVQTQVFQRQEGWEVVDLLHSCRVLLSCFSLGFSKWDYLSECASRAQNHSLLHMGSIDKTDGGWHPCCGGTTESNCQTTSHTQERGSTAIHHPLTLKAKENYITDAPSNEDSKAYSNLNSSQRDGLVISKCTQVKKKFAHNLILLPLVDQPNSRHCFPPKFHPHHLAFPLQLVFQLQD